MQYKIHDAPNFALLEITFDNVGERIVAEAGAMVAMGPDLEVQTNMRGGLLAAAKRRVLGGESMFQNTYVAKSGGQSLYLAPPVEGDLRVRELAPGETFFLQSGAYLAHLGEELTLDTQWGGVRSFFGGIGFFMLRITGPGTLFFGSYGALHEVDVGHEGYTADTGHIVGFSQGLEFNVRTFGGVKGLFFSGEGLVCDFRGAGKLFLQTRNPTSLAGFLHQYRPVRARGN